MIDRDALAREMRKAWQASFDDWDAIAADIAMRHIEAAVAEERERCAALCDEMTSFDRHTRDTRLTAKALAAAIRAGSPAPAAPVVWTDMQVLIAASTYGDLLDCEVHLPAMRAALEAASREGK